MSTGRLEVICGKDSSGKTAMALGRALQALTEQKTVIVIQFLKGSEKIGNLEVLKRMEPELKVFRFEKSDRYFAELSDAEKKDEQINIRNGLNYAKKVLTTEECDLLVLDEALGLCRVFHLLTDGDLIALRDEAGHIALVAVEWYAAHGRTLFKAALLAREGQIQLPRSCERIVEEHLVEVTDAVE